MLRSIEKPDHLPPDPLYLLRAAGLVDGRAETLDGASRGTTVIVRDSETRAQLKYAFYRLRAQSMRPPKVLTLEELALEILVAVDPSVRRLPGAEAFLALEASVARLSDERPTLCAQLGIADPFSAPRRRSLLRLIEAFRLSAALEVTQSAMTSDLEALRALSDIFDEQIAPRVDRAALIRRARDVVRGGARSTCADGHRSGTTEMARSDRFLVDQVQGWRPLELSFLGALASSTREVIVALEARDRAGILAALNGAEPPSTPRTRAALDPTDLFRWREERAYRPLQLLECRSASQELRTVARRIKAQALTDRACDLESIAVALPDVSYLELAREIFAEYGIPLRDAFGRTMRSTPLAVALLAPLQWLDENGPRWRTLEILRNPHLRLAVGEARRTQLSHVIAVAAPEIDLCEWEFRLPAGLGRRYDAHRRRRLEHDWRRLQEALAIDRTPAAPASWCERHRLLLDQLGFRVGEDDPGARRLSALFEHLASWSTPLLSLRGYLDHVAALLSLSPLGPRAHGVQLTDWSRLDQLVVAELYAVGLAEDRLPRVSSPSGLDDESARRLGQPTADEERVAQWEAFLRALRAPRVHLLRTVDDHGVHVLPSPFWTALVRASGNTGALAVETISVTADSHAVYSQREWQAYLWRNRMGAPDELACREAIAEGLAEVQAADWPNKGIFGGRLSALSPTRLLEGRFGPERPFGPTELERYGRCPFQYFMGEVLALECVESETPDLDSRDRGTLVHEALRQFHRRFESSIRPENLAEARVAMESVIAELTAEFAPHLWALEDRRRFEAVLRRFVELEAETSDHRATPTLIEHTTQLALGPGSRLRGRIDRVDRDPDGFLAVYDYKTGSAPVKTVDALARRIEEGTSLQLPLYLAALREELAAPLAGCGYILLPNEKRAQKTVVCGLRERRGQSFAADRLSARGAVDADELDQLIDRARARAYDFAQRIRRGVFPVRPADEKTCSYCDFRSICRLEEQQNEPELETERYPEPSRVVSRLFLRPVDVEGGGQLERAALSTGLAPGRHAAAELPASSIRSAAGPAGRAAGRVEQAPAQETAIEAHARGPIRPSAAQEEACDVSRHVVLTAPAGSGKTAVLVERYLRLISRGVPPESILALTFTRKAAQEMKARLLAKSGTDPRAAELPERAPSLRIATLHSFCGDLLRRHAGTVMLPPDFVIVDETTAKIETTQRLAAFVDRIARGDRETSLFGALTALAGGFTRRSVIRVLHDALQRRGLLRLHVEQARGHDAESYARLWREALGGELDRRLAPWVDGPFVGQLGELEHQVNAFDAIFGRKPRLSPVPFDAIGDGERPIEERLAAFRSLRQLALKRDDKTKLLRLKRSFGGRGSPQKERIVGSIAAISDRLIAIDAALEGIEFEASDDAALAVTPHVVSLLVAAEAEIDAHKRREGQLDFTDLETLTVELLQNELVRHDLHRSTAHILVDEYQDTSDLQWELLRKMTEEWFSGESAPVPGPLAPTLFIVGDRNQSIYGFREANVELLDQTRDYLQARSARVATPRAEANYRSAEAIIDAVNAFASGAFRDATAEKRRPERGRVELYLYPATDVTFEASFLAERIADELSRTSAEEIAVLVRTRGQLGPIHAALRARGVPVRVFKDPAFFWKAEILDLYCLLALLADPYDDRALVRVLRSPLFGFSDLDLTYLVLNPPTEEPQLLLTFGDETQTNAAPTLRDSSLLAALQRLHQRTDGRRRSKRRREARLEIPPSLITRAREAATTLERWWSIHANGSPRQILRDAWLERGGETLYGLRGGSQALANIDKFFALVGDLESQHGPSFPALAAYFANAYEQEIGEQEADPIEKEAGVQLLTVHAAKGLEFECVFLPGVHREIRTQHSALQHGILSGVALLALKETDEENGPHKTLRRMQQERERAEEARLLYVAMTRARDRLVITGAHTRANSWAQMLLTAYGLPDQMIEVEDVDEHPIPGGVARLGALPKPETERRFGALRFVPYQPPPTLHVEPLDAALDDPRAVTQRARQREGQPRFLHGIPSSPSAADRGVVLHRSLQWLSNERCLDLRRLALQLPRFLDDAEIFTPANREALVTFVEETLSRLVADPLIARWLVSEEPAHNELEFQLVEAGVATVGIIDRLILGEGGVATILDYKTTRFESRDPASIEAAIAERVALYRPQLALYRRATCALFPVSRADAYLLFTELPRLVRVL
ncbi:MAG: PD-(D/E)XK nuclease family protein [Myxococcales bacterium]|nr:PD-(D/E)XK nuclease family protein [Myxococcales bacterium]